MGVTLIRESVFAWCLSSLKDEREKASTFLCGPEDTKYEGDKAEFVVAIPQALNASKIVSYAKGLQATSFKHEGKVQQKTQRV